MRKKPVRKRAPQDLTLRNLRALRKDFDNLRLFVAELALYVRVLSHDVTQK